MKIKDVSEKFQISPDTLRYYEKIGLIHNVSRDKNGIRNYSQENCNTIAFIKCMRAASVSIETQPEKEHKERGKERRQILTEERDRLESRMKDIQEALQHLNWKIKMYDEGKF